MKDKDVRLKQRFQNFENNLNCLKEALEIKTPDRTQRTGMILFFEMGFELSWNVMKDYLESAGFANLKSPREVIKESFETGLITKGQEWLEFLGDRNLTSHAYDEQIAKEIEALIRQKYFPLMEDLRKTLISKLYE